MKILIAFALLALPLSAQLKSNLNFTVTYPVSATGVTFYVYGSTNVAVPVDQWPMLYTATTTNFIRPCQLGPTWFFSAKASNEIGLSDFSMVAPVQAGPRSDSSLSAKPQ